MAGDPTYVREQIDADPVWRTAFILSECLNDNAPLGWSKYIWVAESLQRANAARLAQAERERDELLRLQKANEGRVKEIVDAELLARAERAEQERDALRAWLDSNTSYYNTAESERPVLASVSKRIWYHATDDIESYPFSVVARAAIGDGTW